MLKIEQQILSFKSWVDNKVMLFLSETIIIYQESKSSDSFKELFNHPYLNFMQSVNYINW